MKYIVVVWCSLFIINVLEAQVAMKTPIIWRDSIPKMDAGFWATYPKKEKEKDCPLCKAVEKQKWKVVSSEIHHYLQRINGKSRYSSMEKYAKLQFWLGSKPCVQWAVLSGQLPNVVPSQSVVNVQFVLKDKTTISKKISLRHGTKIYSATKEGMMPEDLVFLRLLD